jgi:predicted aspartyl protease
MRAVLLSWTLALAGLILLPGRGWSAECGPLKLINQVQLQAADQGRLELIPVRINGTEKLFIFDTGSPISSVSRAVADELKLPVRQGDFTLYDVEGHISRDQAAVKELSFGRSRINDTFLPVLSNPEFSNGLFGGDFLKRYDADLDFGSDVLRIFSQDHCPGGVQYWQAPATGVVPISDQDSFITVSVTLDGREIKAIIDTGAAQTTMSQEIARTVFGLSLGAPGAEEVRDFPAAPGAKIYSHTFGSLTFGDIEVKNPRVDLMPDLVGRNEERQQLVGNRARTERDLIKLPELIIGLNILRKLHIYMAFGERRLYVSPASVAGAQVAPASGSK